MLNIEETGWTLHRSTNEGAQSPDEWMSALQHVGEKTKKTKRRNPRYAKTQTVETAKFSSYSLELETLSFLIVHVTHNMGGWELHDCTRDITWGAEHGRLVTA